MHFGNQNLLVDQHQPQQAKHVVSVSNLRENAHSSRPQADPHRHHKVCGVYDLCWFDSTTSATGTTELAFSSEYDLPNAVDPLQQ